MEYGLGFVDPPLQRLRVSDRNFADVTIFVVFRFWNISNKSMSISQNWEEEMAWNFQQYHNMSSTSWISK